MFTNSATTDHVHDGDTATFIIFLWLDDQTIRVRCRFASCYCPELKNPDGTPNGKGVQAQQFVYKVLHGKTVSINTYTRDNYGRPLVDVYVTYSGKQVLLNDLLVQMGYATKIPLSLQIENDKPALTLILNKKNARHTKNK